MDRFFDIAVGFAALLIIGVFHPIVIKSEYHSALAFCASRILA